MQGWGQQDGIIPARFHPYLQLRQLTTSPTAAVSALGVGGSHGRGSRVSRVSRRSFHLLCVTVGGNIELSIYQPKQAVVLKISSARLPLRSIRIRNCDVELSMTLMISPGQEHQARDATVLQQSKRHTYGKRE